MASSHCPVFKPSNVSKCIFAGLGLMLAVSVGSFSLGCIFFTSMLLVVSTCYFSSHQTSKKWMPEIVEKEIIEGVAEQVEDKGVFLIQDQEGCMGRALSSLVTISENESLGNEDDNDSCITASEDDEDVSDDGNLGRSSLSSEDDGSISDEDTLIEIELPTGQYLSPKEIQQHKLSSKQKLPDQYSCNRKEQRWMELLLEVNNELAFEEDNFIEIDISIGSIIHPRFGIQA